MAFFNSLLKKLQNVRAKWADSLSGLFGASKIDAAFWGNLEETLIAGDVGIDTAEILVEDLKRIQQEHKYKAASDLLEQFKILLIQQLKSVPGMGKPFVCENGLQVILLAGVNGSGKTTTAGKLAMIFTKSGKKVIIAAADTFRAAAIDQLQVWGERAGIRVIAQKQGSDSAAVVFDALTAAKNASADMLIIDTAGRLQSKHNLMEELGKVYRIVQREVGNENLESIIVLDAVMGQNAFKQAELFKEVVHLTGVVLAKYDNTAKGGIILPIAEKLRLPIRYVGLGESAEDLQLFNPENFVEALLSRPDVAV